MTPDWEYVLIVKWLSRKQHYPRRGTCDVLPHTELQIEPVL